MFDWDDLKFFLAVARTGNTLTAAKQVGVTQSTVWRRIAILEQQLSGELFERDRTGFRLTALGRKLLPIAQKVEQETLSVLQMIRSESCGRKLRLTAPDHVPEYFIIPFLKEFHQACPDISLEIVTRNVCLDLSRGEADISLRICDRPDDESLFGRRLLDISWSIYCGPEFAQMRGYPRCFSDLADFPLLAGDAHSAHPQNWLAQTVPNAQIAASLGSLSEFITALQANLGVTVMPDGFGTEGLHRCFTLHERKRSLWLLAPLRLKSSQTLRQFMTFFVPRFEGVARDFRRRTAQAEPQLSDKTQAS